MDRGTNSAPNIKRLCNGEYRPGQLHTIQSSSPRYHCCRCTCTMYKTGCIKDGEKRKILKRFPKETIVVYGHGQSHICGGSCGDQTIAHDRKWRQSRVLSGRMFCAFHIRLSGAFWQQVTKSRNRNWPCPEAVLIGSRFCACPVFPRVFSLVVVIWLPDVTEGHLTTFGVPLGVRMRNQKLYNTRSDRRSRDSLWKCPWGVLYDVRVLKP